MADETMSLEQVRDWHLRECEIWQEAQEDDNAEHNLACARAIEVAIAERKVAYKIPVAWLLTKGTMRKLVKTEKCARSWIGWKVTP